MHEDRGLDIWCTLG